MTCSGIVLGADGPVHMSGDWMWNWLRDMFSRAINSGVRGFGSSPSIGNDPCQASQSLTENAELP
eukprot:932674-Prorocentrum_minimum.AAC.2